MTEIGFDEAGRLPAAGDNVAIASRRLEQGTAILRGSKRFELDYTVMEGHRFAVEPVAPGAELLSWGLPFGVATADIRPGSYVCNPGMLEALNGRRIDFELPAAPNFEDRIRPYELDRDRFLPGRQVPLLEEPGTFSGFARGRRGAGTRNYAVIMGTTSRTASYARLLAARLQDAGGANFDGVVAIAHTEGGGPGIPNNKELLLRTLGGFAVHPNVGAVLAVDYGSESVSNAQLREYLRAGGYAIDDMPHRFLSISGSFDDALAEGERVVRGWLEPLNRNGRTEQPLSGLKLALQCGGSDAFSGISGNPLAARVARELIRRGGAANLAETDELIGAEPYVLQNVRDLETAERFLHMVERFKERVAWHGSTAEGNPSGGNKFRGLYNIVLKSIGAARKRDPDVRLDHAIDYAEPMREPGYYFMDSPGNDLESIAGQVAAGSNMIFFVTGNGSITNFPFVPTIKIVTTSQRFRLLAEDMDVDAGAYQEGTPMEELAAGLFAHTREVASGKRSRGEQAGHSQVSIWRNWPQRDRSNLETLLAAPVPSGEPHSIATETPPEIRFMAAVGGEGSTATGRVGLVLPTSLCAGQIARLTAERLNVRAVGAEKGITRFVSLVHTEGCGVTGYDTEGIYARTLVGYLSHPLVSVGLLMEHGCEKTHNDYFREQLKKMGRSEAEFGWASVQLDGGIESVMNGVESWFCDRIEAMEEPRYAEVGLESLRLGMICAGPLGDRSAAAFSQLCRWIAGAGGTVVISENSGLGANPAFTDGLHTDALLPNLGHGERFSLPGSFCMETPSDHWVETLTGLGATGVEVVLAHAGEHPMQTHPLVPVVQVSGRDAVKADFGNDLDLSIDESEAPESIAQALLECLVAVAAGTISPKLSARGNSDFQITRGRLGVST